MNTQPSLEDWQDELEASLPTDDGEPMLVRIYKETKSTQDLAKSFAPRRALVIADQQTAGRGRLGRSWQSAPGAAVLMSLSWPSSKLSATHDRVSMLAGVAVARAVDSLKPSAPIRLKWPNDVMAEHRKLAGILIEAANGAYIIGIGLNATPQACDHPAIRDRSTCLTQLGCAADRLQVIQAIASQLSQALATHNHTPMLDEWRTRAALGQTQTFEHHSQRITGEVLDLDPDHGLIVRRDTGEIITLPAATTSVVS